MIKRGMFAFALILTLFLIGFISAEACDLDVSLLNQDPYPAIPGDYAKLVFQVEGINNPNCGLVTVELKDEFPISFDPDQQKQVTIQAGVYERRYSSFLMVPYKVRIDRQAINGENPIEVHYTSYKDGTTTDKLKEFSINIEEVRSDFEVFVKDYDIDTNLLTLQILNIGETDVEALTIEIPKQDIIQIKGANRNIVGDLDSNEYTTADFEAVSSGGDILLDVIYTDTTGVRRNVSKTVNFDLDYFTDRNNGQKKVSVFVYVIIVLIVIAIIWWIAKKISNKRKHKQQHHSS